MYGNIHDYGAESSRFRELWRISTAGVYDDYEQPEFENFSDEDQQLEYDYHKEDQ